jgi:uncharacterized protein YcnI
MVKIPRVLLAGAVLAALSTEPALAHVVAFPAQAPAGSQTIVAFRVGHGCNGSATTVIHLTIPDAVVQAKPRPKPGWTIEIAKAPIPGGKLRATDVTWRGYLSDDQFDDFQLLLTLPDKGQTLYFPTVQTCDAGEEKWVQIPAERAMTGLDHPAPSVSVTGSAAASSDHQH